jgi:hypothetical protein
VRAPRCEWPGCGARASRCDLDHDLAWPHGATCACNCGPLCRRHHRAKQLAWAHKPDPLAELSPAGREHERWTLDPTDPYFDGLDSDAPDLGAWRRTQDLTAQKHWNAELAGLRRQVHRTPH